MKNDAEIAEEFMQRILQTERKYAAGLSTNSEKLLSRLVFDTAVLLVRAEQYTALSSLLATISQDLAARSFNRGGAIG